MVLGSFYLRMTNSGNLIGEFSNNSLNRISTESADRDLDSAVGGFDGNYHTTWFEGHAEFLQLNISINSIPNESIFTLVWSKNNIISFRGEGFIVDDLLIGNYWDEEVQEAIRRAQEPA